MKSFRELTIVFAVAAVRLEVPVVCAVVVCCSSAGEDQAVLASLQCQRSVGAEEELIAVFGVSVSLLSDRFWTAGALCKS